MFIWRWTLTKLEEELERERDKADFFDRTRIETEKRNRQLAADLAVAKSQLAFLERVLDRQCGPARVAACGVPKKAQGPLVQRVLFASRDEAALLVPGVKHDSVGYVGHFEWGADYVEVHVRDDTDYRKMRDRLGYD